MIKTPFWGQSRDNSGFKDSYYLPGFISTAPFPGQLWHKPFKPSNLWQSCQIFRFTFVT